MITAEQYSILQQNLFSSCSLSLLFCSDDSQQFDRSRNFPLNHDLPAVFFLLRVDPN